MFNINEIHTLYVSNEYGDDKNSGLFVHNDDNNSGPFKTIEMALQTAADMRMFGAKQPLRIRIIDSVYNVKKPIVIDSGIFQLGFKKIDMSQVGAN